MRVRRSVAVLCAVVPLAAAAAACSDSTGGTITAVNLTLKTHEVHNPVPGECHRFDAGGVNRVRNQTGSDIRLHTGTDCDDPRGTSSFYLASTLSASSVPGKPLWRSFSTVGWLPPVPAN
jgi:hypothetical protein